MDAVTGIAPNAVYDRYQHLLQGLKNGGVSYKDALSEHLDMEPQRRGLHAFSANAVQPPADPDERRMWEQEPDRFYAVRKGRELVAKRMTDEQYASLVKGAKANTRANEEYKAPGANAALKPSRPSIARETSPSDERVRVYQAHERGNLESLLKHQEARSTTQDHIAASKAYDHAGELTGKGFIADHPLGREKYIFDDHFMRHRVWQSYDAVAEDYLRDYAGKHQSEWKSAAKELGIGIEGPSYMTQFHDAPKGYSFTETGFDVWSDVPKTKAEKIFRHLADPLDIAAFDRRMEPYREEMEEKMRSYVSGVLEASYEDMKKFEPHIEAMREAGITPDDLARILLVRHGDAYRVEHRGTLDPDKADAIEGFVNSNPDVRALYNETPTLRKGLWATHKPFQALGDGVYA